MVGFLRFNFDMNISKLLCAGAVAAAVFAAGALRAADEQGKPATTKLIPTSKLFPDEIAAKGKGFEITTSQVEEEFVAFKANTAAQGGSVPDEKRAEFEGKILDRLVVTQVLLGRATNDDRKKARESVDKYIADAKKEAPSEESFHRQLRALGLTPEKFQAKMMERAIAEEVFIREVKGKVTTKAEQVKKFYEENPQRFESPEMVRASHILFSTRDLGTRQELAPEQKLAKKKLAESVLVLAKKGGDFAKLAQEYSEDNKSRDKGGEYIFPRGQFRDAIEFETVAFSLPVNQVSELITSQYGFHIVKVSEKLPAKKTELAKVEDKIKDFLAQQEADKQMPEYLERIKKEAGVEILAGKPKQ